MSLQRTLSSLTADIVGSVRVTTSCAAAAYLLPELLVHLRGEAPQLQIELVASDELKNLLRREADIAVRMVRPTQAGLTSRRIGTAPLGAFAHTSYLERHGTPRVPTDLLGHALIGYDTDETMLRGFRRAGVQIEKDAFVLRSDDHIVQWQAIRAGLGIGFTACYIASSDPDVVQLVPELWLPPLPVWLICHREIRGNPKIRLVFDFLARAIAVRLSAA